MRWTKEMPREGQWRTRQVRAWLPIRFRTSAEDGTPLRTWIWLERYQIDELYQYGSWRHRGCKML